MDSRHSMGSDSLMARRGWPRSMTAMALGLCLPAALGAARCGEARPERAPTAPSPVFESLAGTWTGTLSETSLGTGRLIVVVDEHVVPGLGRALSGSWSLWRENSTHDGSGTVTGTIEEGGTAFLQLRPSHPPSCPPPAPPFEAPPAGSRWLRLAVSMRQLTGSSEYVPCSAAGSGPRGRVELSR